MKWSFLTTNYNKADTISVSIPSMIASLPEDGELIVVDGGSTDGSIEDLRKLEEEYNQLTVFVEEANLGEGRQIAFNKSSGEIVVQQFDTDMRYEDLTEYLDLYQSLNIDGIFLMTLDSLYISSRNVVERIGGYPPLGRIDERVLTDRAIATPSVKPRLYPRTKSVELESKDTSTLQLRIKKWKKNARDQLRTGFSLGQIFRFHHHQFPFPKALVADAIAVVAALEARGMERYGRERESWTEIPSWEYGIDKDSEIVLDGPEEFGVLE